MGNVVALEELAHRYVGDRFQPEEGWSAQVVIFTGTRYERMPTGSCSDQIKGPAGVSSEHRSNSTNHGK